MEKAVEREVQKQWGRIYQRGVVLWIKYYVNGKPVRKSTKSCRVEVAEAKLRAIQRQLESGRAPDPKAERVKVSELFEPYYQQYVNVEHRKDGRHLKRRWELRLKPFFGDLRAAQVTNRLLVEYVAKRQQQKAKDGTINRELAALRRMFKLAAEGDAPKIERVPTFPRLKERNVRTGFVAETDYTGLAEACSRVGLWMRTALEIGYLFGWRRSEIIGLRVRHVDLLAGELRLDSGTTKNDDGRVVMFEANSTLYKLLAAAITGKSANAPLLCYSDGKPVRGFRKEWETICVDLGLAHRVCRKCGQDQITAARCPNKECRSRNLRYVGLLFHDLRRSAVRNMVRKGIPQKVAMAYSGHKTTNVFDRYNIVSESDLREAGRKITAPGPATPEARPEPDGHNSGHRNVPEPQSKSLAGTAQTQ